MTQPNRLKQLSRQVYLAYHDDGLIDIVIGLPIVGFGLMMLFDSPLWIFLSWLPIALYVPLKNRLTIPRFGYVQFDSKQKSRSRLLNLILLGAALFLLFVGLAFFFTSSDVPAALRTLMSRFYMLLLGGIFALMLVMGGLITGLRRLYIYAALALIIVTGGILLAIPEAAYVIALGAVITSVGLVLLIRFLAANPRSEATDGDGL